jgi:hypothetical protein
VLDEHGGTLSTLRQLLDHSVVLHRVYPGRGPCLNASFRCR